MGMHRWMFVVALIAVEAKLFTVIMRALGLDPWAWSWLVPALADPPAEFLPASYRWPGLEIAGGWLVFLAVELTPIGVALLYYVLAAPRPIARRDAAAPI